MEAKFLATIREEDNFVNATELAILLGVKVNHWKEWVEKKERLSNIVNLVGFDVTHLIQQKKRYATFIHPLLAKTLIDYSKSMHKDAFMSLLKPIIAPWMENDEVEEDNTLDVQHIEEDMVSLVSIYLIKCVLNVLCLDSKVNIDH